MRVEGFGIGLSALGVFGISFYGSRGLYPPHKSLSTRSQCDLVTYIGVKRDGRVGNKRFPVDGG